MAEHTIEKKNSMLCKHRFPCNTLTHSINEDLLNIKRKGDPEVSYPLSYVRHHWNPNPCVIKVIYILIYLISSDILTRIFVSTRKLTFWDFVRNDNSNKGATARLNKSSPIYLGPKNLDTFWCTGWAWNCQKFSDVRAFMAVPVSYW
jgi:hypothetical protein